MLTTIISLNSINKFDVFMVKYGVLFDVRTRFLSVT
jgi:hypothetical protein